jgi:hypothetical protein
VVAVAFAGNWCAGARLDAPCKGQAEDAALASSRRVLYKSVNDFRPDSFTREFVRKTMLLQVVRATAMYA